MNCDFDSSPESLNGNEVHKQSVKRRVACIYMRLKYVWKGDEGPRREDPRCAQAVMLPNLPMDKVS